MKTIYFDDEFFDTLDSLALNLTTYLTGYFGGKHKISKYGQTVEFADFREYQYGDDIRRIDWNLFARFNKYFLKLFTDERQMHIKIFIDCSTSMGFYSQKAQHTIKLAVALGYLAIRNNDKVTFYLLQNGNLIDLFGLIVGKNSFFNAVNSLKDINFVGYADYHKILNTPLSSSDGLCVLISDFLTQENWQKAVDYFIYKNQQVLVCQVLDQEEISPSYTGKLDLIDCEGSGAGDEKNVHICITRSMMKSYEQELKNYIQSIKKFCASRQANFITFSTTESIEKVIFNQLAGFELVR